MESIWIERWSAFVEADRAFRAAAKQVGLSVAAFHALIALYMGKGDRPIDIARMIGRQPTSFTPVLDELERAGMIERADDQHDRRVKRLMLTDRAREWQDQAMIAFRQAQMSATPKRARSKQ